MICEGIRKVPCTINIHAFFISNTFISKARLKLSKNQAKAKQHPEVEHLLFEKYLLSSSTLSSKNNKRHSKKCTRNKCVYYWRLWLMAIKMRLKIKNRSQGYNINRPRHGLEYTKYKMCLSIMMVIYGYIY